MTINGIGITLSFAAFSSALTYWATSRRLDAKVAKAVSKLTAENAELRETKETFNEAQRIAKIASWDIDPRTGVLKWSDYYYEMMELSREEFDGTWTSLLPMFDEENRKLILDNFAKTMATKEAQDLDFAVTTKSGVRKCIHTRGSLHFDENGNIVRMVGTSQDVTESRRIEGELRQAQIAAEDASRAKSNFLANMSHEIRTPLGIILGFSELLADPDESPESREMYMKAIKRNGTLLSELISDILDLSKVEAGQIEARKEEVDLRGFLEDIDILLRPRASEAKLEFVLRSFGPLPEKVMMDARLLKQAFVNVVGNAIKFTKQGQVEVRTSMMTTASGKSRLVFDIVDTGIGMTESQVSRLFERFTQVDDTSTRKFGGTGLGLALSRRFVQIMGGDLRVRYSSPGRGTCFRFILDPGPLEGRKFTRSLSAHAPAEPQRRLERRSVQPTHHAPDANMH